MTGARRTPLDAEHIRIIRAASENRLRKNLATLRWEIFTDDFRRTEKPPITLAREKVTERGLITRHTDCPAATAEGMEVLRIWDAGAAEKKAWWER